MDNGGLTIIDSDRFYFHLQVTIIEIDLPESLFFPFRIRLCVYYVPARVIPPLCEYVIPVSEE